MIIADTSALIAFFDAADPAHDEIAAIIEAERAPIVVPPLVCAEIDHLVSRRLGAHVARQVLTELTSGAYAIADLGVADLKDAAAVLDRYADRRLGLVDATIVVLAERLRGAAVATLDRRDFGGLVRADGSPLALVP